MAIVRSRELLPNWDEIPAKLLQYCIKEHRDGIERIQKLEDYYKGKHEILKRDLGGDDKGLPNNKLVANHAKYITDVASGYFGGDPVKYTGKQIEPITDAYKAADVASHDSEMVKDLSMYGISLELHYMSSDDPPIPRVSCIDPRQIFLVVDDSVEYKSLFAVHYYEKRDMENKAIGWYVNVYTANKIARYEIKDIGGEDFEQISSTNHYYKTVPVVEFWNNEEQQGDFEQQLSLINAYNTLGSDRMNDKEQFVDSILKLIGASLGDTEEDAGRTIRMLKKYKVLELPAGVDADASWLTKTLNEADTEVLRNALKSDIHEFSMVPNLTDEKFAGNVSGEAMKYKLFGLEKLAETKERYFVQGLRERLKLFANILQVKAQAVAINDVEITMTRSLPSNDTETALLISQLSGHVSNETLISQLSFVKDPVAENEKVMAEKAQALKDQQAAFGMPMGDQNDDEDPVTDDEDEE
ncbi:phage portal protein [Paenibacillus sp. OK076]|uniref:phage portal protein n=1 Tax=Paenibacillus sp. OK076 TaxID=1884379 RepID=UPI0008C83312|nr:phage portal protein [Paenibacillus sp. OK076]SEO11426.1 phage portal protein, SPP1 family [Paenibacillus sp. OK076]